MIRLAALVIVFITVALVPAYSSPRYKIYAEQLLGQLPSKAVIRPDLEKLLNQLASGARIQKGKSAVRPSLLLMQAARAQAVEMIIGNFVGHKSRSGYRFKNRFEAFAGDGHGEFGENAARDRQPGKVDAVKARRLFQQWIDSSTHKRNMLNRYYTYVSSGAVQVGNHLYAVQIFWEK